MTAIESHVRRYRPARETLLWGALLLNLELLLVMGYLLVSDGMITNPFPTVIYPLVWINAAILAVATTTVGPTNTRRRWVAAVVAVGYFGVLAYVGGIVNPGHAFHGHVHATGLRVEVLSLPPGWNPAVYYGGSLVSVALTPFKLAGYLALAYLVYATVIDTAGTAVFGVAGLFSCVSCTWPIVGTVVTSLFGSAAGVIALSHAYGISTVVFLSALGLLYYRPWIGGRRSADRRPSD